MFDVDVVDEPNERATALRREVDTARAALERAARIDVTGVDDTVLREAALELEATRRVLDATSAHTLVELHDENVTERHEGLKTSRWLARDGLLPAGVARTRVTTALQVHRFLPQVVDELTAGRIGFDHTRVFAEATNARNAEAMAIAAPALCDLAQTMAFARWRQEVLAIGALLDPDGSHDPADDLLRNRLSLSNSDEFLLLRGELVGEHALAFHQAVDAKADELFRRFSRDREQFPDQQIPNRATLRALALVELCTGPTPDTHASIVIHTNPESDDPAAPVHAGGCGCEHHTPVVTDPTGRRLSQATAALLVCTAVFHVLTTTPAGNPTGSTDSYRPTRAQRRQLAHRDGGCVFPGCGAPQAHTDAHHMRSWPAGPTELWNLISLCRHHHRIAHRHGWTVTLDEDGWTQWTNPTGDTRWGQRHHRQRAGPV